MSIVPNSQHKDSKGKGVGKSPNTQEFQFINGMASRLLLVIEPQSSEFVIESGDTLRVRVEHQSTEEAIEVEYLPGGMVMYTSDSGQLEVYQNGRRLPLTTQTRGMAIKLNR